MSLDDGKFIIDTTGSSEGKFGIDDDGKFKICGPDDCCNEEPPPLDECCEAAIACPTDNCFDNQCDQEGYPDCFRYRVWTGSQVFVTIDIDVEAAGDPACSLSGEGTLDYDSCSPGDPTEWGTLSGGSKWSGTIVASDGTVFHVEATWPNFIVWVDPDTEEIVCDYGWDISFSPTFAGPCYTEIGATSSESDDHGNAIGCTPEQMTWTKTFTGVPPFNPGYSITVTLTPMNVDRCPQPE